MTAFISAVLAAGLLLWPAVSPAVEDQETAQLMERAYTYNRDGMIAMSQAQFDEAIGHFQKAADLVPDYGITRRGLRYTPNFMIGWAHEKNGESEEACRYFRRFLDLAPAQMVEESKADHASQYLNQHCPSLQKQSVPSDGYGL
jgi:tetratricopeptide (TPR) repeat protein